MDILERVKSLGLPDKQFVVMGSAILELKGIRQANDLDIMLTKDLFWKLKDDPTWRYVHKHGRLGDEIDLLEREGVQLYLSVWGREDFEYFMAEPYRTELIEGIYFCSLENLLEAKSGKWDREKDLKDAELIKTYLAHK